MRFILGFAVLLVLLIGGLLMAPSFINWDQYKDQGLAQVKAQTGYDVTIEGPFKIAFLPAPHVKASGVKVVNPSASKEPIATFDDLSVGVAVAPLLQKQVQVTDVRLVKPVFDLRVDRSGKGNWLSTEVEAMLSKKDDGSEKSASGASQNIAFNNVSIEKGAFRFFDVAKNKNIEASDIDVSLSAKSLKGPFDGKGTLTFGGQDVAFDVAAQTIDGDALPLRLNAQYGPYGVALNGVAGIVAPFDVQGETQIKLSAVGLPISDDVVIKGTLSADQKKAAIKDASVVIGAASFAGQGEIAMKPLDVKAVFEGNDVINLAQFLPAGRSQEKGKDPLLTLTEILPKSITLPQDFTADVALKTGGIVHQQILLKNARVQFTKKDRNFNVSIKADDIPGTGPASIDADVAFASRSASKTGAQVYSDPTLNFTVQANTQNTGNFVKALTGKTNIPIASTARIGRFYLKGDAKPGRFALKDSVVNLDDLKVLMSGDVRQGEAKPVVDFNVSSSVDDPYAFAKSLNVKTESWPKNLGAVRLGADLKGTVDDLAADAKVNAFGADFTVSGKLNELISGDALDNLNLRVQHPNLQTFLSSFGASAPAYTAMTKPIDVRAVVKMDGKVVSLNGVKAKMLGTDFSGSLRYDGSASKPSVSGDLNFGELSLKTAKGSGGSGQGSGGSSSGGKWSTAPIKTDWLHAMNANFDVSGERLFYETWDIAKPSLKMVLQAGALDIQNLKGGLFGGQVALQSKASAQRGLGNPLSVSTQATMSNVNIEKLASALSSSKKLQGSGTVSLGLNVSGSGTSQKALVSSLNGDAKLDGANVVLKGFDLAGLASALLESNKPLARVQQLVGGASSGGQTAFDTVKGEYAISKGIVTITSMALEGEAASIVSTGNVDLPKWYIDANHQITLVNATDIEPFDVPTQGSLSNPKTTFSRALFDTYLNEKLGEKIGDLIGKNLGDDVTDKLQKFGILPTKREAPAPVNDNTEPAAGDAAQPAAEQPAEQKPKSIEEELQGVAEDALGDVLKGLF